MAENRGTGGFVRIGSRKFELPRSRLLRIVIGSLLILFGIFGFLPIVGFWMIPLGLLVLSIDIPAVRRWRRRVAVWFARKYPGTAAKLRITGKNNHYNNAARNKEGSP